VNFGKRLQQKDEFFAGGFFVVDDDSVDGHERIFLV
jgi:hypothetical protein